MPQCRICFEDVSMNELISPCLCDGTSRYIHPSCLEQWRNTGTRAFSQCSECNFSYIIEYKYPVETFKLVGYDGRRDFGIYVFLLFLFIVSSFFLRKLDKWYDYYSLTVLNGGNSPPDEQIELIKTDEIYSGSFYFSLNMLIISIVSYIFFLSHAITKVKRPVKYWKYFFLVYFIHLLGSVHFVWGYWGLNFSLDTFELFINLDTFLSLFNGIFFTTSRSLKIQLVILCFNLYKSNSLVVKTPRFLCIGRI